MVKDKNSPSHSPKNRQVKTTTTGIKEPPFQWTMRDTTIMEYIALRRGLKAPQVSTVCFWADPRTRSNWKPIAHKNCQRRLQLLYLQGYLLRIEQSTTSTEGRKHYIYTLSEKGYRALSDKLGCDVQDIPHRPLRQQHDSRFLEHLMWINDVWAALVYAAQKEKTQIVAWIDDAQLKKDHSQLTFSWSWPSGQVEENTYIVPDAYAQLSIGDSGRTAHLFWEIDRGQETGISSVEYRRTFERKIRMYEAFYESGVYTHHYHAKGMRVLTVTSSQKRLDYLKTLAERVSKTPRYWFTLIEKVTPLTILSEPIWHRSHHNDVRAIITVD